MAERRVTKVGRPQYGRYGAVPTSAPRRRTRRRSPFAAGQGIHVPRRQLLVGAIVLLAAWFVWSRFELNAVKVTSTSRSNDVKSETAKLAAKSLWQHNLLTLNTGKLTADLIAADPQLKSVTISRSWPNQLSVTVTEKQPAIGWTTGSQSYLLDHDGTVIGTLPAGNTLPVVVDGSNLPVQIGQKIATSRFVTFVSEIAAGMPATGVTVTSYRVKDTTFDLYAQTSKPYQLIFDTTRPAADELADLKTILKALGRTVPSSYIDMRIAGKAYYK